MGIALGGAALGGKVGAATGCLLGTVCALRVYGPLPQEVASAAAGGVILGAGTGAVGGAVAVAILCDDDEEPVK